MVVSRSNASRGAGMGNVKDQPVPEGMSHAHLQRLVSRRLRPPVLLWTRGIAPGHAPFRRQPMPWSQAVTVASRMAAEGSALHGTQGQCLFTLFDANEGPLSQGKFPTPTSE